MSMQTDNSDSELRVQPKAGQHPSKEHEVREDRRLHGKISRLNQGFGFIEGENGIDYFFHWSALSRFSRKFSFLKLNDPVNFQPGRTPQGPRAFDVLTIESNGS